MRLPKEAQLSVEQKEICYAPTEGTILVIGPPGSGKTVVAMYRARTLEALDEKLQFLVYNHVLRRYTESGSTFYSWIGSWWKSCTGSWPASTYGEVEQFGKLRKTRVTNFHAMVSRAQKRYRDAIRSQGHWGHLILDEAQDFAPEAHRLLFVVANVVFEDLEPEQRPALTILADENQRLGSTNCTLDEIRESHMVLSDDIYELRQNYRNTREIAAFAGTFYVGLPSGQPELPTARGEKPAVVLTSDIDDAIERIVRYAGNFEDQDIGVLVFFNNTRQKFFRRLRNRLESMGVPVQTYTSDRDDPNNDANRLRFEAGGSVTVLCFASAKGLEFDAVFLPELQSFPVSAERRDEARMSLYVMCSRARQRLFLSISDRGQRADVWSLLPDDPSLYELEAER